MGRSKFSKEVKHYQVDEHQLDHNQVNVLLYIIRNQGIPRFKLADAQDWGYSKTYLYTHVQILNMGGYISIDKNDRIYPLKKGEDALHWYMFKSLERDNERN